MIVILTRKMPLNPTGTKRLDYKKGDSVDIPDAIARKMIEDGRATLPVAKSPGRPKKDVKKSDKKKD